ncbi:MULTISPECIES: hypothetical protein [unclassified Burkholderia]|uniref:hypothetical protein n=1 Tax=unclassified Burkholderia TaxID=2613784 RepID=UPI001420A0B0|nr:MULTISPECIES: hypothetical protein [unclassified Burkholderia]
MPSLDLAIVSLVDARLTSKQMGETKMETLVTLVEAARAKVAQTRPRPARTG